MKSLLICALATAWVVNYVVRRLQESRDRESRDVVARARHEQERGGRAWKGYPDAEMIETYGNGR